VSFRDVVLAETTGAPDADLYTDADEYVYLFTMVTPLPLPPCKQQFVMTCQLASASTRSQQALPCKRLLPFLDLLLMPAGCVATQTDDAASRGSQRLSILMALPPTTGMRDIHVATPPLGLDYSHTPSQGPKPVATSARKPVPQKAAPPAAPGYADLRKARAKSSKGQAYGTSGLEVCNAGTLAVARGGYDEHTDAHLLEETHDCDCIVAGHRIGRTLV
jgi:hypothetical protein